MKTKLCFPPRASFLALAAVLLSTLNFQLSTAFAQGTAFTYQGRLNDGANPATGIYDLRFAIYDSTNSPGTLIAGPLTNAATVVSNGLFTVTLDFGAAVFTGGGRWLEIGVRSGGGAFAALSPRQAITPVPYAAYAMTPAGPQGPQGTPGSTDAWSRTGNAGTSPTTNFLGTTDNQPLEFKVNNQRGLRLEYVNDGPDVEGINVIGGYSGNSVSSGIVRATIAGGGRVGQINQVTASIGTVGGGEGNTASGTGGATVGGGAGNTAGGGGAATVGGGLGNTANGFTATTIGGGERNTASGDRATIPGGYHNAANGDFAFAAGRQAQANHQGAFVWADSTDADFPSTANNQFNVRASGGARFVTGGAGLTVDGSPVALRTGGNAFSGNQSITGGKVGIGTVSPDGMLGVSGGDIGADEGGQNSGTTSFGLRFGGSGSTEFIGSKRTAGGNQFGLDFYTANSTRVSIRNNGNVGIGTASPATALHVIGAADTEISVESSSAGGHRWTLQSSHGDPAFGRAAFQIIDRTLGAGRMLIWTNGDVGIGFGFATPASKLHVNGTVTATAFNPPSDRNLKENFTEISSRAVLDKVAALPISRWNFKGDAATPHVGPMAQDFHAAFGLGTDDKHIATVDADGVALAAIQGLNQKIEEREASLRAENARLQRKNAALETRLAVLEKLMTRLTEAKGGE